MQAKPSAAKGFGLSAWCYRGLWALLIVLYLALSLGHLSDYAWNYDEGPQLQAGGLVYAGYPLYSEVVVNKPPLMSWSLALGFGLGGMTLESARLTTLLLTLIGFVALGMLAEMWWGRGAGVVAMGLFLAIPEVPVRAAVVMNDLPSISLALVSLVAATYYRRTRAWPGVVVSALAYALAILFHPLMFYMAAPALVILFYPFGGRAFVTRKLYLWLGAWIGVVAAVVAVTLLPVDLKAFVQWVFGYNLNAGLVERISENWELFWTYGSTHRALIGMAVVSLGTSAVLLAHRRFWLGILLLWSYLTVVVLSFLRPLWPHYTVFISYPLVLLVSGTLTGSLHWVAHLKDETTRGGWLKPVWVGLLCLGMGWFGIERAAAPLAWTSWLGDDLKQRDFLAQECKPGEFMVSDRQFVSFAAGCLVAPPLADTSGKRFETGLLRESDIVDALMRYPIRLFSVSTGFYKEEFNFQYGEALLASSKQCFGPSCIYQFDRAVFSPLHESDSVIADTVRLWGYSLQGVSEPGEEGVLSLFWESLAPTEENWKVFVHVLDASGTLVAQHDGWLFMGGCPTNTLRPGQWIVDPHPLTLGVDLAPGEYRIAVGMYREPTFERLPAFSSEGRWADDMIILQTVNLGS